jgi:RNA ligase (TIGR02306 family)
MERKLARVEKIINIRNIADADKIQEANIQMWNVVIKKDLFKENELVLFIEIDSIVPTWFLSNNKEDTVLIRIKTIRLKKRISQGLVLPLETATAFGINISELTEGEDLTDRLGIKKYEPPAPAFFSGEIAGNFTPFIHKTDELRINGFPELFKEMQGLSVYITQKIDGTSASYALKDGVFYVCSRNMHLREKEGKPSIYFDMARKYGIENILKQWQEENGDEWAIQGEIAGPGIQKNRMGLAERELFVFNIFNITKQKFLNYYAFFSETMKGGPLQSVPVLGCATFSWTNVEELLQICKKHTYQPSNCKQEGIVVRPVEEKYSYVLGSRMSFKVINPEYLLENE